MSFAKKASSLLLVAACLAAPSIAHADTRAASAHPHVEVGGPLLCGVRLVVRLADDPTALAEVFGRSSALEAPWRAPTWLAPEFQKPQYHTAIIEVTF